MHINFKHIGLRVKEIRIIKKMSQAELAEQIDMSAPHMSRIETASSKVSLQTLVLIANALGVTIDTFLNGNQTNDPMEYNNDWIQLTDDCNSYERRVIFDIATAAKKSLRNNACLHPLFEVE